MALPPKRILQGKFCFSTDGEQGMTWEVRKETKRPKLAYARRAL
jgi:hypothetical protein